MADTGNHNADAAAKSAGARTEWFARDVRCPTCNLGWGVNPPVRCADGNRFLCVECKAIYTGEMLAASDLLTQLQAALPYVQKVAQTNPTMANNVRRQIVATEKLKSIRAAISKVTGSAS